MWCIMYIKTCWERPPAASDSFGPGSASDSAALVSGRPVSESLGVCLG